MNLSWITTTWQTLIIVFLSAMLLYAALILLTRFVGLRSFSKMSSFDFVVTIAIGAMIGGAIITPDPPVFQAITAIGSLFILQIIVNYARTRLPSVTNTLDNKPFLLMEGPQMLEKNLKKARVTQKEIRHKLRQSNVTKLSQVKAVILEPNGEVSVLHHSDKNHQIDESLLRDVNRGAYS